jgi:hypothetical protein
MMHIPEALIGGRKVCDDSFLMIHYSRTHQLSEKRNASLLAGLKKKWEGT